MTVDEIERLLRVGMCSPGRHAEVGCATCDAYNAAIAAVRERFAPTEPERRMADAAAALARNGVWGTCVDCPDADGNTYGQHRGPTTFPERCPNFERYDHRLTAEQFDRSLAAERWNYERDPAIAFIDAKRMDFAIRVGDPKTNGVSIEGCGSLRRAILDVARELGRTRRP